MGCRPIQGTWQQVREGTQIIPLGGKYFQEEKDMSDSKANLFPGLSGRGGDRRWAAAGVADERILTIYRQQDKRKVRGRRVRGVRFAKKYDEIQYSENLGRKRKSVCGSGWR